MSARAVPAKRKLKLIHRASGDMSRARKLGPYCIESLVSRAEEGAATVYRVTIGPNERTRISYHRIAEEFYFVIAGRGTAILDGREHKLARGDLLRLPPGTTHGFVTGRAGLDMLNIHAPGCRPDHDVYFADGAPPAGFEQRDGGGRKTV